MLKDSASVFSKCHIFIIVCLLSLFTIAIADAEETVLIMQVEVQNNQRIEDDAILRVTRAKAGDLYNEAVLSEDLQSIYKMGWFDDVRVEVEKSQDGNTVIFIVKEKQIRTRSKVWKKLFKSCFFKNKKCSIFAFIK